MLRLRIAIATTIACLLSTSSFSQSDIGIIDPWMTGPLLAPAGHTIPAGHTNWEPYIFVTDDFGVYGSHWRAHSVPRTITTSPNLIVTRGLAKRFDIQTSIPYSFNEKEGQSDNAFADIALILGFQAIDVPKDSPWPNLRVTLQETFPSGKYNNRSATKLGTDITGIGSYQTSFGVNFQKYTKFNNGHYLRSRLSVVYTVPSDVQVNGFNAFGGGFFTNGTVTVGNKFAVDLAFEYTLTQHWVPAIDFTYNHTDKSTFRGRPGITPMGTRASVGTKTQETFTLAPALEYNFNASLGVIAGAWFSIEGKNTPEFLSWVAALNYYV